MNNPKIYNLTEEEHQEIFDEKIKPFFLSNALSISSPTAIIFGGQPGSGKSTLLTLVNDELIGNARAVVIAGDSFRQYHTPYKELLALGYKDAAFLTSEDIGRWVEKAIIYSGQMRYNMAIEGTMRESSGISNLLKKLHQAHYKTDIRVLAVNDRISWQRVLLRYEIECAKSEPGRMVLPKIHADSYRGLLKTLDKIEQERLADRLTVYKADGTLLYENELEKGEWKIKPQGKLTLEKERSQPGLGSV